MKQFQGEVLFNGPAMEGVNLMWLRGPEIAAEAQPGQFVLVRCADGYDPLLRRALSIHRMGLVPGADGARGFALLYGLHGPGTSYLRARRAGDTLDVIAPLGKGFSVRRDSRYLLLVGGGWGVAPMVALAEQQVARGKSVTLISGAAQASLQFPVSLLPQEVEVILATVDGSAGHKGMVTDLLPQYWEWADEMFCCGPMVMYTGIWEAVTKLWPSKRIQVLAEIGMACGVGACYACTIHTRRGHKLACVDGPRFYLSDLMV